MTWHAACGRSASSARLAILADVQAVFRGAVESPPAGYNPPGAVWVSVLQLAIFSLGWRSPAFGLYRWLRMGFPTTDPRLEVIAHLIGPDVNGSTLDLLALLYESFEGQRLSMVAPGALTARDWDSVVRPSEVSTYATGWWSTGHDAMPFGGLYGSPDPCHISFRALLLVQDWGPDPEGWLFHDLKTGTAVLVLDGYERWYCNLHALTGELEPRSDGRSCRVDVVVKPVGWLGTYRLLRLTGRWFSGPIRCTSGVGSPDALAEPG